MAYMNKYMLYMLLGVAVLFGLVFGWKGIKSFMIAKFIANMGQPAVTVSTMKVEESAWQPKLRAVGSLRAQVGVNVTTELAGLVQEINFKPGAVVKKGELLVQLNAGTELGQLHALQAQVELAKITFQRDKSQFNAHAVSKQVVDTDEWNLKNLQAQVEQQSATVNKKTIVAPFAGHLGINNINPGQFLKEGDIITTLQALDPIYADFYLPQQDLAKLEVGQPVSVLSDTFPKITFKGKITTIQPAVDVNTRNVQVEATLPNPGLKLKPGMFVQVQVDAEKPQNFITVPQTAISFNPYGNIIYVVKDTGKKDKKNKPIITVEQVFVTVGDTRGDQIAITKGLKVGDVIVTSGQLKLKNGSTIIINNMVQPSNEPNPDITEKK